MASPHYYQLKSRNYRFLKLKLRLAGLIGFTQRSDIVGQYGYIRTRREFIYSVYVGRRYDW